MALFMSSDDGVTFGLQKDRELEQSRGRRTDSVPRIHGLAFGAEGGWACRAAGSLDSWAGEGAPGSTDAPWSEEGLVRDGHRWVHLLDDLAD